MTDVFRYDNKRVVVTGCSSGIGHATAQALLELGAQVCGLDLKQTDLALHEFVYADLRDPASIDAAVSKIEGSVDCLFNCAGIPPGPSSLDVVKVNFIGTRHLTDRVVPLMRNGGAIVNVASNGGAAWASHLSDLLPFTATNSFDAALRWLDGRMETLANAYSFSKEALIVWTMAISGDLIKQGIRVNCTSPGAVQTPMLEAIEKVTPAARIDIMTQPIGRRSGAEEQAFALIFLNSDAASYVNGVLLPVDGGFLGSVSVGGFKFQNKQPE